MIIRRDIDVLLQFSQDAGPTRQSWLVRGIASPGLETADTSLRQRTIRSALTAFALFCFDVYIITRQAFLS